MDLFFSGYQIYKVSITLELDEKKKSENPGGFSLFSKIGRGWEHHQIMGMVYPYSHYSKGDAAHRTFF